MRPEARNPEQTRAQADLTKSRDAFEDARIQYEFAIGDASKWLSVRQVADIIETSKSQVSRGTFKVTVRTDWGRYIDTE